MPLRPSRNAGDDVPPPSAPAAPPDRPSLKQLAEYLSLSPSTVSFVLNNSPNRSIPEATRERIREAARRFHYQPSLIARKLQGKHMRTVGILLPELDQGYHSEVLSGAGDLLLEQDYFFFTVHHRHRPDLLRAYPELLSARGVEGLLTIDTRLEAPSHLPTVQVGGPPDLSGGPHVSVDSSRGAELTLTYLFELGHRRIVFMRGQPLSADTVARWSATLEAAHKLGLATPEERIIRLEQEPLSPPHQPPGYAGIKRILDTGQYFTAVVCFNDTAAMGVIRALHDAGLRVPQDVSVVGYDDILPANYHVPSITTVRQPLQRMGSLAAYTLLQLLSGESPSGRLTVEPELVLRESSAPAPDSAWAQS